MNTSLPVIEEWYNFLRWLLERTNKFPKKIRFSITSRIDNLALMILEDLISARYEKANKKKEILNQVNIHLEKLRFMIRLSYDSRYLAKKSYEHSMEKLLLVGKQVGGWHKKIK